MRSNYNEKLKFHSEMYDPPVDIDTIKYKIFIAEQVYQEDNERQTTCRYGLVIL